MRATCTLLFLVLNSLVFSQWSSDPATPLVISDAPGQQRYLQALEDGQGGWYLLWRDDRVSGQRKLYGQHLDNDGYSQWDPNGRLLLEVPGRNVNEFAATILAGGDILVLYGHHTQTSYVDTMSAMLMDTTGTHLWQSPLIVAHPISPLLRFQQPRILPSGAGALIAYYGLVVGGNLNTRVDRINADGTLQVGINGQNIPNNNAHGPMDMVTDENDGAIVHWRNSNGGGTHIGVLRIDSNAVQVWPGNVDPVAGTPGLYWDYRAIADGEGGLAIAYVEAGGNGIKFARLDSTGASAITPSTKPAGVFVSGQDLPKLVLHDGHFFVCWQDNRPPANNQDLYIQKLDMNGDPVWDPTGELAVQINTYIPHARIVPTDSGGVIMMQLTSVDGLVAQRVRNNGSTAWPTLPILATDDKVPFYGEFETLPDGLGGAVSFWYNTNDQDLYAARVDFYGSTGITTGTSDLGETTFVQMIYPNPNAGNFELRIPEFSGSQSFSVIDALGRTVQTSTATTAINQIDLSQRSRGTYLLILETAQGRIMERFVIN